MSRVDDLLQRRCPDGVQSFKLGEICTVAKGKTAIQKANPGDYPLVVTAKERKTSDAYQFDSPAVCVPLVSSKGHGIACLKQLHYQEGRFALGNILCAVQPNDPAQVSAKYLYHYLDHNKDLLIVPLMRGGANVALHPKSLLNVVVPVPPLEVQQEFVRILDAFTELEANLQRELDARKRQYEHYRDELLTFDESLSRKKMVEICSNVCSGGTPSSKNKEYYDGDIPWLRTQEVDFCEIYETGMTISQKGLSNSAAKWIPENCLIIAMYGATAAKAAINRVPLTTNQACCNLEKILPCRLLVFNSPRSPLTWA